MLPKKCTNKINFFKCDLLAPIVCIGLLVIYTEFCTSHCIIYFFYRDFMSHTEYPGSYMHIDIHYKERFAISYQRAMKYTTQDLLGNDMYLLFYVNHQTTSPTNPTKNFFVTILRSNWHSAIK